MSDRGTSGGGPLGGRVALITGAASGIGAASARRLHAQGARLVLADPGAPRRSTPCSIW